MVAEVDKSKVAAQVIDFVTGLAKSGLSRLLSIFDIIPNISSGFKGFLSFLKEMGFKSPTLEPLLAQAGDTLGGIEQKVSGIQKSAEASVAGLVGDVGRKTAQNFGITVEQPAKDAAQLASAAGAKANGAPDTPIPAHTPTNLPPKSAQRSG
jgi:hypothetical protein